MNDAHTQESLVDFYCKELKLPGLRRAYREIAREALAQGRAPIDFLAACLAQELASRRESRLAQQQTGPGTVSSCQDSGELRLHAGPHLAQGQGAAAGKG